MFTPLLDMSSHCTQSIKCYTTCKAFEKCICIATDIFGHGIHVELAKVVINYDCPPSPLLTWTLTPRALLSLMFATDIFGCGIHVELVNISPLTWTLTPKALLSLRFAMNIFAHGIDVELVNIVPPS